MLFNTEKLQKRHLEKRLKQANLRIIEISRISKFPVPATYFDLSFGWQSENDSPYRIEVSNDEQSPQVIYAVVTTILGAFVVWSRFFREGSTKMEDINLADLGTGV